MPLKTPLVLTIWSQLRLPWCASMGAKHHWQPETLVLTFILELKATELKFLGVLFLRAHLFK